MKKIRLIARFSKLPLVKETDISQPDTAIEISVGQEVLIGRHSESDLVVALPHVSRRHARVFAGMDGEFYIEDLSKGGTFVGEDLIDPDYHYLVEAGDIITIANLEIELEAAAPSGAIVNNANSNAQEFRQPESSQAVEALRFDSSAEVSGLEQASSLPSWFQKKTDTTASAKELPPFSLLDSDVAGEAQERSQQSFQQPFQEPPKETAIADFFVGATTTDTLTTDATSIDAVQSADSLSVEGSRFDAEKMIQKALLDGQSQPRKSVQDESVHDETAACNGLVSGSARDSGNGLYNERGNGHEALPSDVSKLFFKQLGLDDDTLDQYSGQLEALLPEMGTVLKDCLLALMSTLRSQQKFRQSLSIENTVFERPKINPLYESRFSSSDIIRFSFLENNPGFLRLHSAIQEAAEEMKDHEVRVVSALDASFASTLESFAPEKIIQLVDAEKPSGFPTLLKNKKQSYWETYCHFYQTKKTTLTEYANLQHQDFADFYVNVKYAIREEKDKGVDHPPLK